MEHRNTEILEVLNEYIHKRKDKEVMITYLTDRPESLEAIAYEHDISVSTVKRIINRNSFVYKYLPD